MRDMCNHQGRTQHRELIQCRRLEDHKQLDNRFPGWGSKIPTPSRERNQRQRIGLGHHSSSLWSWTWFAHYNKHLACTEEMIDSDRWLKQFMAEYSRTPTYHSTFPSSRSVHWLAARHSRLAQETEWIIRHYINISLSFDTRAFRRHFPCRRTRAFVVVRGASPQWWCALGVLSYAW